MKHMLAALLNLLLQTNARSAPPPLPYYTHHVTCWCEKCDGQDQAGHWTAARELSAYRKQGVASLRFFSVSPGEQITVLDGVVIVDRDDLIRVLKPMTALDVPGEFEPGDAIWRVQIMAEGGAVIWHNGRMVETVLDGLEDCQERRPACSGIIEQKGIRQWWIKVRNVRGQIGWVRADWNFADDSCGTLQRR